MKLIALLLAGCLGSAGAAQAQTTPTQTAPGSSTTLTPSSAAPALNPNSADNSRALPATGAPDAIDNTMPTSGKRMAKDKKQKSTMSSGEGKMHPKK